MKKILIVEDQEKEALALKEFLEDEGFQIKIALYGQHALHLIRENPKEFDLVVLDILLPDIDGIHLLQTIKRDINSKIFVIMHTWYDYRDDFDVWLSEAYVIKGKESNDELLLEIKRLLKI